MSSPRRIPCLPLLFLAVCTLAVAASAPAEHCARITHIEGEYVCHGECVVTVNGERKVVEVKRETDRVERYPEAKEALYQVHVTGEGGFRELEVGAFDGRVLRTATAQVTDKLYPVLEEYVFKTEDDSCTAKSFQKIVRNPIEGNFKACIIYCERSAALRR